MATPVASIPVDQFAVYVTDGVARVVGAEVIVEAMPSGEPAVGYTDPAAREEVDWPVLSDITGRASVWLPVGVYRWTATSGEASVDGVFASSPARARRSAGDEQLVRLPGPAFPGPPS